MPCNMCALHGTTAPFPKSVAIAALWTRIRKQRGTTSHESSAAFDLKFLNAIAASGAGTQIGGKPVWPMQRSPGFSSLSALAAQSDRYCGSQRLRHRGGTRARLLSMSAASAASSMVASFPLRTTGRPPTRTVSTARPASANTICRAALLNGTKAGSLRSRITRSAIIPGLIAPSLSRRPDRSRSGQRCGLQRIAGVDRTGLRVGHSRQQAQQSHGDEDILRLGATVVVAAQRDLDTSTVKVKDRRDAALELEVAHRIVHDARSCFGELRDISVASQTPCTMLRRSFISPALARLSNTDEGALAAELLRLGYASRTHA